MIMESHTFNKTLQHYQRDINKTLGSLLRTRGMIPPVLHKAIRYSVLQGGKRIRPMLCVSAYTAAKKNIVPQSYQSILLAACSLELIHCYSLIHDDLPAMDNDDFRRGKPTAHRVFGEDIAILAGDALQPFAFTVLTNAPGFLPQHLLEASRCLALALGPAGLVAGQVVDLISEKKHSGARTLRFIHTHKTGDLIRVSLEIGAILAGASGNTKNCLSAYGTHIGLAFQIADDILDEQSSFAVIGKKPRGDIKNKKLTYPLLFGITASKKLLSQEVKKAQNAIAPLKTRAEFLQALADYIGRRGGVIPPC